jgi:rhodanese-related sulfurtransferase
MHELRSIFFEAALLVICGCLLGLVLNYQLVFDAFGGRLASAEQASATSADHSRLPTPILLEEVKTLREQGAVLVDARPSDVYALGHIAGARSLPLLDLDARFADFRDHVDREQTVVTYCSGYGCQDSFDLAMHLISEGYLDVRIYEGGFPEWQDAGLVTARGGP